LYLDTSQESANAWKYFLTKAGRAAIQDQDWNPDYTEAYVRRHQERVPDVDPLVIRYADEALRSYINGCYLASAIMLGGAAEAAFLDLGRSFAKWTGGTKGDAYRTFVDGPRQFGPKFEDFRKKIEGRRAELPETFTDQMDIILWSILNLIRIHRNSAGHPRDVTIGRRDVFNHLLAFAYCLEKMYALRAFFDAHRSTS